MRLLLAAVAAAIVVLLPAPPASAEWVWWEAENPAATNFPRDTWISAKTFDATRNDILSGGDWLTGGGKAGAQPMFARYALSVKGGDYVFWARKFWKHGPFRWRFDSAPWRTCGGDVGLADSVDIRQWVCVNWVCLGDVKLAPGNHAFEIQLLAKPGEDTNSAFDCFLLTTDAFAPRGKFKPDERSGKAEPGWWAFEPPADTFGKAELDLRSLNEKSAGESGFVKRAGDAFALGSGKPVRFWAVNVGGDVVRLGNAPHRYIARRLAKVGVNLVRIHSGVFDASSPDPKIIDAAYLDALHHFISELKAEGIYVELSFYYPVWFDIKPTYGFPGYSSIENKTPFAIHMFDPRMQDIYRTWARALLTTKNPYTGLPLGQDPAVAIVEIVNEDSYLFWSFNEKNVPRAQMAELEKLFGAWLVKKYGTLDAAAAAWRTGLRPGDAPKEGRMEVLQAWFMTGDGAARSGLRARSADQLRFLVENQRAFYEETARFFRKDLGVKPLITCSNWITADARVLDGLERWTYTAGDIIDQHGYFEGEHKGAHTGWAVERGDTFKDRAGVLEPGALPLHVDRVDGFPHTMSESGWPNPNRFKAEFPFLASACASTSGLNGIFFFAVGDVGWESSEKKFPCACPTIMGQFPALALMYRRGDMKLPRVVHRDSLRLDDLFAFKGSPAFDPLLYCLGPVVRSFDGAPHDMPPDANGLIDAGAKKLKNATGEMSWDWGRGVVAVNTPKSQGATGFLSKAGAVALGDVVIEAKNEFATIVVTALDDKPLAQSSRILIQAMTEERPYGWKTEGGKIIDLGGFPFNVRNIDATVTFKTRAPKTLTILDEQGYRRESHPAGAKVTLPPNAVYCIVE